MCSHSPLDDRLKWRAISSFKAIQSQQNHSMVTSVLDSGTQVMETSVNYPPVGTTTHDTCSLEYTGVQPGTSVPVYLVKVAQW